MNRSAIEQTTRFIVLVLLQVLILNNINFLGDINPYVYVLFIALFPVINNRMTFIFLSFLIGLCIDIFSDTGGVHAAASVFVGYARPLFLKFAFGMTYEHQTIRISQSDVGQRLIYFTLIILVHHVILFSLEIFNLSMIPSILKLTLFSGIFTILLSILGTTLFSKRIK
ncbi:MAG: rod shape-determining protein MreD [bacterium]